MSTEEQAQLRRAAELRRPIARAAVLGRRNGLGYLLFGVLGGFLALPSLDPLGLAISALLVATGLVEMKASRRLARADRAAPALLARTELSLLAGIVAYCVLQLTVSRPNLEELTAQLGDTSALGVDVEALTDSLTTLVYTLCIAVTLLYQGGMARYFLRRRSMIAAYLAQCPEWAREVVLGLGE